MENASKPLLPPRRHWYQFSLRTLLIFMLVAGTGFGYFGIKLREGWRQKEAVKAIRKAGGTAMYEFEFDNSRRFDEPTKVHVPGWLIDILGVDFFYSINVVYLYHATDDDLKNLLEPLTALKSLYLASGRFGDVGLNSLERFTQLEFFYIDTHGKGRTTSEGLNCLKRLKQLKYLDFALPQLTDADLANFTDLPKLKSLTLRGAKINGEGLAHLKNSTQLQELSLSGAPVTDAGLEALQKLSSLEELFVNEARVTDTGLQHLKHLPHLKRLELRNNRVTDEGLEQLAKIAQLEVIDLRGTQATEAGLEKLRAALPNCKIIEP